MAHSFFTWLHHANAHLRESVFYVSSITIILVFILLIVAMIRFQKRKVNFGLEIVWAVIPFVMLFVMMTPIVNMFIYQSQENPAEMVTALMEK